MTNHEETEADFGPLNTLKGTKRERTKWSGGGKKRLGGDRFVHEKAGLGEESGEMGGSEGHPAYNC